MIRMTFARRAKTTATNLFPEDLPRSSAPRRCDPICEEEQVRRRSRLHLRSRCRACRNSLCSCSRPTRTRPARKVGVGHSAVFPNVYTYVFRFKAIELVDIDG